ncbi:hypothetical protein QCA50_003213 [Cerrena zonata]|uniref:Uncharacterized protein n=1 Tax=Cerrena zonata TaxID=2478898 RepID=A0AAW0GP86_9APHY
MYSQKKSGCKSGTLNALYGAPLDVVSSKPCHTVTRYRELKISTTDSSSPHASLGIRFMISAQPLRKEASLSP